MDIWRFVLAKAFLFVVILVGGTLLVGLRVLLKRYMKPGVLKTVLLSDIDDHRSLREIIRTEKQRAREAATPQSPAPARIRQEPVGVAAPEAAKKSLPPALG